MFMKRKHYAISITLFIMLLLLQLYFILFIQVHNRKALSQLFKLFHTFPFSYISVYGTQADRHYVAYKQDPGPHGDHSLGSDKWVIVQKVIKEIKGCNGLICWNHMTRALKQQRWTIKHEFFIVITKWLVINTIMCHHISVFSFSDELSWWCVLAQLTLTVTKTKFSNFLA